ncbi:MAG: Dabb family protein [Verrucomicrobiota bacterium]
MVRHNVYFWLDESLSDEQKQEFEGGLAALAEIDVVDSGTFGTAAGTPERPVTQNTFDYALVLEFASVEQHNAYQVHDDHHVFVDRFSPWFREVRVFDTQF